MLIAYRLLGILLLPLLLGWYGIRLIRGKERAARWRERWGLDGKARPPGHLIWVHAASVGESLAVLPLIESLLARHPDSHVLVTTGTVTSADILAQRLPERAFHRFVPLDVFPAVWAFLHHWKPDLALFVESELWPCLLTESHRRGVPVVMVNARMSEKSFRFWQGKPALAGPVMQSIRRVLAQGQGDADRFRQLGVRDAVYIGNLKYDAPPLPADPKAMNHLTAMTGGRPLWVAASTHPGEESQIAEAHRKIRESFPDTLTVVIPRHAARGEAIASELNGMGLSVARRSRHDSLTDQDIYLADTMGELGLFYRLADIVFMGGSLVPHGGQNPLEAARLEAVVLSGPHLHNFTDIGRDLYQAEALMLVQSSDQLAEQVVRLLQQPDERERRITRTRQAVESRTGIVTRMLEQLTPWLTAAPPSNLKAAS